MFRGFISKSAPEKIVFFFFGGVGIWMHTVDCEAVFHNVRHVLLGWVEPQKSVLSPSSNTEGNSWTAPQARNVGGRGSFLLCQGPRGKWCWGTSTLAATCTSRFHISCGVSGVPAAGQKMDTVQNILMLLSGWYDCHVGLSRHVVLSTPQKPNGVSPFYHIYPYFTSISALRPIVRPKNGAVRPKFLQTLAGAGAAAVTAALEKPAAHQDAMSARCQQWRSQDLQCCRKNMHILLEISWDDGSNIK